MSTPVEQIKERLGIADVVGSYLKLERAGSSLKAKCPFHNEKTPSFFVSPARGGYYCFGCQAKGDIFTFVQEFEGLDFIGALRVLAERAGVTLTKIDPKVKSEHARLYLCLEKATRFYEEALQNNSEAKAYIEGRGLTPKTIQEWRLGFVPNDWRQLFEHLLKEGFKPEEMGKVGLIKRAQTEGEAIKFYDTFRGRVMYPIRDSAGRVIAFSGRILPTLDDGKTGKYINSPETVLFSKSNTLYGFDKAKLIIRELDAAILVEGQMDLLMAHQAGYGNTVASSGTALTEEQLTRLKRLSENLLIAFDSDKAGLVASERAIRLALALGVNVKVISLREKDPADLILKEPGEWERAVKGAKHIIDFLLENLLHSAKEGRERALAIEKTLLPLLRLLPSSVEQSHFLKVIAEKSGLREEALWTAFKKIPTSFQGKEQQESPKASGTVRSNTLERRVFSVYFLAESRNDATLLGRVRGNLIRALGQELFDKKVKQYEALHDVLLLEAETLYGEGALGPNEEEELIRHLEEDHITRLLSGAMDALANAEREGRKDEANRLLNTCKELTQKLAGLKSARFLP
ncbi:MAG TPA: DNA primase [Candidatus Taylorbacteria bacterium]|nr:MAG: primase protein [Parcubacteria group bacterium GW2011_GWA2_47_64]KKU96960.1 MAG: primase protein [Parcubacteria group bacterium GW2011_GWC2_48_17]HBV00860.1 DNA primase [Candidatus Taylorbacteria bacterium]